MQRRAQRFNGREGETATFLFGLSVSLTLRGGGFASRPLNYYASKAEVVFRMIVLETERVILRRLTANDAAFILNLLNQPSFIRYIGDRGVRNLSDARLYIETKFIESYQRFGFGLYLVELKPDQTPIGICGFVKRDALPDADIGFAFLPEYWSQGYGVESARAAFDYGKSVLGFKRILAITTKDNEGSGKLLAKVGLKYERMIRLSDKDDEAKLFSSDV